MSDSFPSRIDGAVGQLALLKAYGAGQHDAMVDDVVVLLIELRELATSYPSPAVAAALVAPAAQVIADRVVERAWGALLGLACAAVVALSTALVIGIFMRPGLAG